MVAAAARHVDYRIQARLRRARKLRRLSVYRLAILSGLQASTIQRIEEGVIQKPNVETLAKLEHGLGLRRGALLNGRI
jgi:transcriptional regulator with XRE-family HTH domain